MGSILESNLSRPGVEELSFGGDPQDYLARLCQRADSCKKWLWITGLLSTGVALLPISPGWAMGGYTIAILFGAGSLLVHERGEDYAPYIPLWEAWKDESTLKNEAARLEAKARELKNSSYTGQSISWLSQRNFFDVQLQLKESAVARDGHWRAFCDDLAEAASQVGKLSVQSDRSLFFRSMLLYSVQQSVEALSNVALDVEDKRGWFVLLERKFEVAHLLSWITRKDPPLINGYPNRLSDMERGVSEEMTRRYTTRLNDLSMSP